MSKKNISENMPETIKSYVLSIEEYPRLSSEETKALALRKHEDEEARALLINSNLRLVLHYVNYKNRRGMDYMDCVMAGNEGLIQGIDKYDPVKFGTELSTCVMPWIRQAVDRAIINNFRTIRIPIETSREIDKVLNCRNLYYMEHETWPSNEIVAKELGFSVKKVANLIAWSAPTTSIDELIKNEDNDGKSVGDSISDQDENKSSNTPKSPDPYTSFLNKLVLSDALATLSVREKLIITYRFGLNGVGEHTLKELAEILNLSRESIRQTEAKALKKLLNKIGEVRD